MPSYDSRNDPSAVRAEALREFRHNSPVAEFLCEAMTRLESHQLAGTCSPELRAWWSAHKNRDANKSAGL